jgi:hypothetical protein
MTLVAAIMKAGGIVDEGAAMMGGISSNAGLFANANDLAEILIAVGQIGVENEMIKEIDINPVIITDGKPVAVDALVVLEGK